MERLTRAIALTLLLALLASAPLRSGETGKVAGRITDKVTGVDLTAANIFMVDGVTLGDPRNSEPMTRIPPLPPGW